MIGYNPQQVEEPITIPKDLLDALMKDYKNPEDLIGKTGLLKQLLERAMQAEMTEHLGYAKNAQSKKTSDVKEGFVVIPINHDCQDGLKPYPDSWFAAFLGHSSVYVRCCKKFGPDTASRGVLGVVRGQL